MRFWKTAILAFDFAWKPFAGFRKTLLTCILHIKRSEFFTYRGKAGGNWAFGWIDVRFTQRSEASEAAILVDALHVCCRFWFKMNRTRPSRYRLKQTQWCTAKASGGKRHCVHQALKATRMAGLWKPQEWLAKSEAGDETLAARIDSWTRLPEQSRWCLWYGFKMV